MRIVSQNGTHDVPYYKYTIELGNDFLCRNAIMAYNGGAHLPLGTYADKATALEVMQAMRAMYAQSRKADPGADELYFYMPEDDDGR